MSLKSLSRRVQITYVGEIIIFDTLNHIWQFDFKIVLNKKFTLKASFLPAPNPHKKSQFVDIKRCIKNVTS